MSCRVYFRLVRVIAEARGGNSARWLNHACAPNCETIEDQGRIFIHTLRSIDVGEELFIEYLLATDDPLDEDVRAQYACRCATAECRHSISLARLCEAPSKRGSRA